MSVKLTNFVKITINHHLNNNSNATRDTAILYNYKYAASHSEIAPTLLTAKPADYTGTAYAGVKNYIDSFFDNGGKKLYVITSDALIDNKLNITKDLANKLEVLPMEYLVVGLANDSTNSTHAVEEVVFRAAAAAWNLSKADEKIYQKIFVAEIPYANESTDLTAYENNDEKVVNIENYVLKYGELGIGASVLAYYTSLNIYDNDATQDYAFTTEKYSETGHFVFNDNTIIEKIIKLDLNADTKLANTIKNVGGNDTAGYDLTNQFMLLVLHQTLTNTVMQVLLNKIKYNNSGLSYILNALVKELNRFVNNGYLSTNKVWTDIDLYYKGYKIIDENTVLNSGYKVAILPFNSLTPDQLNAHQLPEIYILLADSYSIRKVVITGEVF